MLIWSSGQPQRVRRKIGLRSLIEGFEFLWHTRIVLSLFLLDFFAVLVGYYRPLLPIFSSDIFKVGAGGLGALYAAPALGAPSPAMLVPASVPSPRIGAPNATRHLLFRAQPWISGNLKVVLDGLIAVGALGFSDSISVAIRRTMVQMLAPDQMRGRASSFRRSSRRQPTLSAP
jgi:hypothetical protein